MELLHLVATPRTNGSNTLRISKVFIEGLRKKYPELKITTLDLFQTEIPAMAGDKIETKYLIMQGGNLKENFTATWTEIESFIGGFMRADMYLISAPMWNFTIPFVLKYYIDTIVQPSYLFKYLEDGTPVGLCDGKMVVIKTSGSDYSNPPLSYLDFHEPYLRGIFGFCGITDIHFISAYNMDITPEIREQSITSAIHDQVPGILAQL
ncbi:MAG: NAD(P)H-dependent oxidoreductase [Anaerolineae bacterium]|nr:NAD(P)H-dependent oxidoreductase [Anaerolineae bacterium]